MDKKLEVFKELIEVVARLRKECPWDKEQTFDSLKYYTIEEAYELLEAVVTNDNNEISVELGDLLLHVLMYSEIAEELKLFSIIDVMEKLKNKLISRHPHVFGVEKANNAKQVVHNWEKIKEKQNGDKSILSGIPKSLPTLLKAYRIQEKVSGIGFDWKNKNEVWNKVKEEIAEIEEGVKSNSPADKIAEEFGDLLFSLVNASRLYGINPEDALNLSIEKFIKRFNYIEKKAKEQNKYLSEMTLEQMDELWNEAKGLL